jgi:hypothetical protein
MRKESTTAHSGVDAVVYGPDKPATKADKESCRADEPVQALFLIK